MLMRIVRQFAHLTFDIRLDGHQLRCREQLRRDGHAPFLDGLDSLQAGSNGSILGFIKFDTPSVNSIEHPHDWANSFPGHALSPLEHDRYRCQQCPVPMFLQGSPAAFDRVVLAVVRRVVNQFNLDVVFVSELSQAFHKLRALAGYFRTVVQIDHQLANVRMLGFALAPPLLEIIRHGIAGGNALAKADH